MTINYQEPYDNQEPVIHSHRSDELPDNHPLAFSDEVFCSCGKMLHAFNNECMTTWVEIPNYQCPAEPNQTFCWECFIKLYPTADW